MNIVTFCSFKGGTAKTSTTLHLGACLAKFHNKRILVVDFDPQANLSIGLNFGPDSMLTLASVLCGQAEIKDIIQKTSIENLSLICANALLDQIEKTNPLSKDLCAHERLSWALKDIEKQFDFCFIDTPPSLGWLTQSAFFASRYSVICSIPEAFSIIALRKLKEFHDDMKANMIKQRREIIIDVLGVVLSFWDDRGATNQDFIKEIERSFPNKAFNAKIRRDVAVSRAVLQGKPVIEVDPNSRASQDYRALAEEFISHFEKAPKEKLKELIKEKSKV